MTRVKFRRICMDSSEQKGLISQRKFTPKCYLIIMASLLSECIIIFETASHHPPPPYLRVLMTGPLPYLMVWIRHCKGIQDRLDPGFHSMTSISSGFQYWSLDSLSVELGFWIPIVTAIPDFLFLEQYSGFQSPGFLISQAKIPGFLFLQEKSDWFACLLVVVIVVLQNSGGL